LKEGLPADLGVVAATACAAEPSERHESCAELAEEIERALNYRPLKRRPPGALRRSALFARRRPVASVALLVTLCAMISAAGVYESQQRRVAAERDRALARFNAASDFARWVIFELERELLMLPGTRAARLQLINEAQKTLNSLLVDPTADDALRLAIAEAHVRLEEIVWYERGDFEAGLENRRSVQRLTEGIEGPEADMLRAWTRFRSGLERTRSTRDPLAPVETTLGALDQLLSLEGKLDDDPRYWRWRARIGYHASRRLVDTDAPPERIRAVLARAVADGKRAIELDPSDPLALREYAEAHVYRALGERNVGGPDADAFSLAAIEAAREVERRGHPDGQALIASAEMQRGKYFEELGAPDEALAMYTQAIERLEPVVALDPDRKSTTRRLEVAYGWRATLCLEELRKGRDDLFDVGYESAKRSLALHKLRIERDWLTAVVEDDYLRHNLDEVEAYEVIKARRRTGE
jgi:tetratricopeptide (TPR) repeat protein